MLDVLNLTSVMQADPNDNQQNWNEPPSTVRIQPPPRRVKDRLPNLSTIGYAIFIIFIIAAIVSTAVAIIFSSSPLEDFLIVIIPFIITIVLSFSGNRLAYLLPISGIIIWSLILFDMLNNLTNVWICTSLIVDCALTLLLSILIIEGSYENSTDGSFGIESSSQSGTYKQ